MRKIFLANFLDSLISEAVMLAVPLLLVARGIDVALIGVLLAAFPLASTAVRLVSSSLANQIGFRLFYLGHGLANLLEVLCYFFAGSWPLVLLGKTFDGAREAFLWAVNRSSIAEVLGKKADQHAWQTVASVRLVGFTTGSLSAGLLMGLFSFEALFLFLSVMALVLLINAWCMPRKTGRNAQVKQTIRNLDFRGKSRTFYLTALAMVAGTVAYMPMIYFILPLLLKGNGFSYESIGLWYALYTLLQGIMLFLLTKWKPVAWVAGVLSGSIMGLAFLALGIISWNYFPLIFILLSLGDGFGYYLWESLIFFATKGSRQLASDIGLLNVPNTLIVSVSMAAFGFALVQFGPLPLFIFTAGAQICFAFFAAAILHKEKVKSVLLPLVPRF